MQNTKLSSRVIAILFLFFISPVFSLSGQQFEYMFNVGDRFLIISTGEQQVYQNDAFSHNARFQNNITVNIIGGTQEEALIRARYRITEQSSANQQLYSVQHEDVVVYRLSSEGVVTVDDDAFLPMVRNIPRFPPTESLAVGDTWAFTAHEVFDLRTVFNIARPFKLITIANYEYIGMTPSPYDQQSYPTVKITYPLEVRRRVRDEAGNNFTISISGGTEQILLWDSVKGRPHSYHEEYQFSWQAGQETVVFNGTAEAYTVELSDSANQARQEELQNALDDSEISGVSVDSDDEGVVLSIGQLHFYPDTARLLAGEEGRITDIAELILQQRPAQVLVTGHTALAGTEAGRQALSELRARTIAELLHRNGIENLIIQGVGATQPLATNENEEGRKRNRRVEIKLIGEKE